MKPIWIVDDDQSIRFVLEKALTREEFAVRSFTNSRDVLAALEDDEPQVLGGWRRSCSVGPAFSTKRMFCLRASM